MADELLRFLRGDTSMLKCTACGAIAGACGCWIKCQKPGCSWSFLKGEDCRNPAHRAPQDGDNA